jgi:signal transduction histidine kinase
MVGKRMKASGPELPLAAAWVRNGTLVPNRRWRELCGEPTEAVWHAWRPGVLSAALSPLDELVRNQPPALTRTTYVHAYGKQVIEVQLEAAEAAADALAVAFDVSPLAGELQQRRLDLLRERARTKSERFHLERVLHDLSNHFHAIEMRVSFLLIEGALGSGSDSHTLLQEIETSGNNARRRLEAHRGAAVEPPLPSLETSAPFDAISLAAALASRDGARLTLAPALASLPRVRGAAEELAIAFVLLFDNAREAGSAVHVDGAVDAERVVITVTDDGPGLDEEVQTKMWKPFFTTRGDAHRGHGLALAVKLLRLRDGILEAANRSDSHGARFTVKLLLA